ncbi:MAG: efflux RND transporter periplasmic adaptor subunit [Anaerolineales bacterium]|nr:efflux RND transporter periplasmic adaptor subunit [Anaerolineales bacterium]
MTTTSGRTKQRIWIIVIVAALAVTGWYAFRLKGRATSQTADNSTTQTAIARQGNLTLSATGSGTLIAQTDASFGFETSGQVTQVNVKVGDQVEAGEVLAQLDDTLAQMEYAEAQQALQELRSPASIAVVQQEIATAKDAKVAARDWLVYLFSAEVIDAEDNLNAAKERLAEAQANAKANPSDATAAEVKKQEKSVDYLNDKLSQAWTYYEDYYLPETFTQYEQQGRNRVVKTETDPLTGKEIPVIRGASTADTAKARNDYAQAIETIKDGELYLEALDTGTIPEGATGEKLNTLYQAQQAVKDAQSAINKTKLIAPISGIVTSFGVNVGEQASTSSTITISQLDQPYMVDAYLDQADWDATKIGNKVNVIFELISEQTFPGTITTVYPELVASGNSSLVHIVVQLDRSLSQNLPVGTGATVSVVGGEAKDVVLVPVEAIHKTKGEYAVTVIQNGDQVERSVEIGIQDDTYVEIKSGLDAGETVVTE